MTISGGQFDNTPSTIISTIFIFKCPPICVESQNATRTRGAYKVEEWLYDLQARIRRVKCDETKPSCIRCQKDDRKCDGYNAFRDPRRRNTQSGKTPPPSVSGALIALPSFDDPRQREFFAFFVSCASNASSVYFGANFWAHRVLQLSLSEASIRYALCSLSALHRMSTVSALTNLGSTATELRKYALQQYSHAVRCTRILLAEISDGSRDKLIEGLVACVLFVCYETFTGNYQVSHMHLQNGLHIITRECRKERHLTIPKDIIQVFKRLDLQAISFSDSRVPYSDHLYKEPIELLTTPPAAVSSIEDSIDIVLHLSRCIFRKAALPESCLIPPENLKSANKALEQWSLEIEHCLPVPRTRTKDQLQRPIALLKMYQIIMTIIIATGVHGQETLHDDHLDKYGQLIVLGEGLLLRGQFSNPESSINQFFCFDVGVIFPLFWVAIKCRESQIRRRAVKLLGSLHHQEGAWKSTSAAKVAEFVICIEEEGLPPGVCQHQVPETARVHLVNATADAERGEIRLSCLLRSNLDNFSWYTRKGRVPYKAELSPA